MIEAVVFDLDGVLLDTEELWDEARREIAEERGGRWRPDAQRAMMGMSSPEWSRYMHDVIGVPDPPERISEEVVERLAELYRRQLPLVDGAIEAVRRIGARWPLGYRLLVEPAPDRPLPRAHGDAGAVPGDGLLGGGCARQAGAGRLPGGGRPSRGGSRALRRDRGLRERHALGLVRRDARRRDPEPRLSAGPEALSLADVVLGSLDELTPETIERA